MTLHFAPQKSRQCAGLSLAHKPLGDNRKQTLVSYSPCLGTSLTTESVSCYRNVAKLFISKHIRVIV